MPENPIIKKALERGRKALSEYESKLLIEEYGVSITPERLVDSADEAVEASFDIGYPVALKACGPDISHKTERELVVLGVRNEDETRKAYDSVVANLNDEPRDGILVQKMVSGEREMVIGLVRDPQFGPCVMFGLGGIFTEILRDTSFRVAPISETDALQMMDEIKAKDILGPVRGMAPADRENLARGLVGLGAIGLEIEEVAEIDVNPLIIDRDGSPVAVDALVVLSPGGT